MSEISIRNFCNISVAVPGKGLGTYNVNTLLYITDDTSITKKPYYLFYDSASIAKTFGTDSKTYQVLNLVFAQSPSLLAPGGYVVVVQRNDITLDNATAGYCKTTSLADNLNDLIAINAGSLTLTVDGEDKQLTNLDFTTATKISEIATILNEKGGENGFTCEGNDKTSIITFTSAITGASSSISIKSGSIAELLNYDKQVIVNGQDEGATKESLNDCIIRANNFLFTEAIIADQSTINDKQDWINTSNYIQGTNRLLFYAENNYSNTQNKSSLSRTLLNINNNKTRVLFYNGTTLKSLQFAGAYSGRALATNMSGSRTTITMNLKDLSGIEGDTSINDTIYTELMDLGYDCYANVEGVGAKVCSSGANDYFDDVFNINWFALKTLVAGFNTIAKTTTKIPQTDEGMSQIKANLKVVCEQALRNGFIAPGKWTSTDYFGDYDTFMRNIEENGYYIYNIPVDEQDPTEREERIAPVFQIAIKFAGAVHKINVMINYNK